MEGNDELPNYNESSRGSVTWLQVIRVIPRITYNLFGFDVNHLKVGSLYLRIVEVRTLSTNPGFIPIG